MSGVGRNTPVQAEKSQEKVKGLCLDKSVCVCESKEVEKCVREIERERVRPRKEKACVCMHACIFEGGRERERETSKFLMKLLSRLKWPQMPHD